MRKFLNLNYLMNIDMDFLYLSIYIIYIFLFIHDLLFSQRIFAFKDWYIPYDSYDHFKYVWDEELFGHVSLFRSIDAIILLFNNIFGLNITQKISFLAIFVLPYISFYVLTRKNFGLDSMSAFLASTLYAINPITIDLLWGGNGAVSVAVIYGTVPIIYHFIIKISRDNDIKHVLVLSIMTAFVSYNLWQLALLLIPILLFHTFVTLNRDTRLHILNIGCKALIIILVISIISLPNLFFNYSRTYIFEDMNIANDMTTSNLKWGYQYVDFNNIFLLEFNPSNYFVYKTCYILDNCNYGYFYVLVSVFIFLGTVVLAIMKRLNKQLIFGIIFSITSLLLILLISNLTKNYQLDDGLVLFLGIVRNPDKLLMIYLFFMSLSFGYVINTLVGTFFRYENNFESKKKILHFLTAFIFLFLLSLSFLPVWDGFGGLTKYYLNDKQSNIELLTISNERNLPYMMNYLNISDERILYLPYCSNGLFASGDQLKNQPFTPNILGIRQEGIQDGYNQKLINNLSYLYSSIAENRSYDINKYLTLFNTNYIVIKKNVDDKKMKVLVLGISRVPYICGSSEDFITIFMNLGYITIFDNDDYMIFGKIEKSLPIIYGLSEYDGKDMDIVNIDHDKIDPTKYSIHMKGNSNITNIIFSNNYDKNWIIQTSDKKIRSENSFLGFNNFKIEIDNDEDVILYYEIQEMFEKFKLLSIGTLILFSIIIMKKDM